MSKGTCLAAVACLLGIASPTAARAQGTVEFTPFFASYYAVTKTTDDFAGTGLKEGQLPAPSVGARLTFWLGSTIGIEAAGAFTPSGTRFTSDDPNANASVSLPGRIITGSARFLYRPARTNLHLLVGGGVINRGGDTWDAFDEVTDFGAVAGFGARAAVTPSFALTISVEGNFYQLDPDGDGSIYDAKIQSDLYVVIGVPISFGRR